MPRLIDAYDSYKDFDREAYFTVCFDLLPSNLSLEIPLKETKENMEAVLTAIDMEVVDIQPIFKNWKTEDVKDPDPSKDYPHEYLLKSSSRKLVIWISLEAEELFVQFFYDMADEELEEWVLATNHLLRTRFGEKRTPTFKVLSHNDRRFYTKDVSMEDFEELDVTKLYNDDFVEVDGLIRASITQNQSGLILLHGTPGTGKTSYIKNLISRFHQQTFIFVQNEFVQQLLKPEFISFLLKHRNSILIIEDAERVIMSREHSNQDSVVSTILQLTDGLFSDYLNLSILCTFNTSMDKVDKALFRKGRMIANYEFKALQKSKASQLSQSLGFGPATGDMTLAEIFKQKQKDFSEGIDRKKIGFSQNAVV